MTDNERKGNQLAVSDPSDEAESPLSSLVYDMSQQAQVAMGNMLKMISEIDQCAAGIVEEIEQCKESANEKKKMLDEEKETFQRAVFNVLNLLKKY